MNVKLLIIRLLSVFLMICVSTKASAYNLTGASWPDATTTFHPNGFRGSNSSFNSAFIEALNQWNGLSSFSFSSINAAADPCGAPNSTRGWEFNSHFCGSSFGISTLAITVFWLGAANELIDADIIFNTAHPWDVHNGSGSNIIDFRRVTTHELGHALGLDHESSNPAIMHPLYSQTIEMPQTDDINGLRAIYGVSTVTSLWRVSDAQCGQSSKLWAQVENTGSSALPSDARVRFWVTGPGWSGTHWVGEASVAGLAPGSTKWYSYNWSIPSDAQVGIYTYWAQVWTTSVPRSLWSAREDFSVTCGSEAQVMSLSEVNGAQCGQSSTLSAEVENTGSSALPSDARVRFWVTGPGWSGTHWVGEASVASLAAGSTQSYSYDWPVPSGAQAGTYRYWAQVWTTSEAISSWSKVKTFEVMCITGNWSGSWVSSSVGGGSLLVNITQSGSSFSATVSMSGSPCLSSGSLSGTITGNNIVGAIVSGGNTINFTLTFTSTSVSGTYSVTAGACAGDTGTISLNK